MKDIEAKRKLRASIPATESTWCVLIQERDMRFMKVDSYHDTHYEATVCADEILESHATASADEIPFVFVCKIHEQNGDA